MVEPTGRVTLPAGARLASGAQAGSTVQAQCRGTTLVLRRGGFGSSLPLDARWRLALPKWLRRAADPSGAVIVAAGATDPSVVLVFPTTSLDDLADHMAGQVK